MKIATSAVERVEDKVEKDEIDVKHAGKDVYSVRTKANEYLIRKTKDNESNTQYHFFYEAKLISE